MSITVCKEVAMITWSSPLTFSKVWGGVRMNPVDVEWVDRTLNNSTNNTNTGFPSF